MRKEWGFRGLVDSDWTSVAELIPHGIANDPATAARKAFLAGVEMDMVSSFYHDNLANLVRSGQVPVSDLNEAVRDVLRFKYALGLFDHPFVRRKTGSRCDASAGECGAGARGCGALLRSAEKFALQVLDRRYFRFRSDSRNVALIGPLADDAAVMLGSWSAQGRPQDAVTLRAALVEKLGADHVRYAKGSEITKASDDQLAEAVKTAQESDVVILTLGENASEMTGEAASRAHLGLPGRQEQLLETIVATGKPVVLVLFSGRPLTLPWAFEHVPAVLAAWFPGLQAGPALVRTLFGDSESKRKTSRVLAARVGQEPLYYDALSTGRPAGNADLTRPPSDGSVKYVSRYIDELNSPQFPFGYGLTYTTFRYGPPQISSTTLSATTLSGGLLGATPSQNSVLTVSADITNTGSARGRGDCSTVRWPDRHEHGTAGTRAERFPANRTRRRGNAARHFSSGAGCLCALG